MLQAKQEFVSYHKQIGNWKNKWKNVASKLANMLQAKLGFIDYCKPTGKLKKMQHTEYNCVRKFDKLAN